MSATTSPATELLYCYNRGCQKKFDPTDNSSEACLHHPGLPKFHDAYKIWSCCQKKSTDFSTFLSLSGCTRSQHNPVKPVEPEKPQQSRDDEDEQSTPVPIVQQQTIPKPLSNEAPERPPTDEPLIELTPKISTSLQQALSKLDLADKSVTTTNGAGAQENTDEVAIGTHCKHAACQEIYKDKNSDTETTCRYHPGVAIFHEGMKYWSCCQKKTCDFQAFTLQVGCTIGKHLWKVEQNLDDPQALKTSCRYDFHQQGNFIVLTLYAKTPIPDKTHIKINQIKLSVETLFEGGKKKFQNEWELYARINPKESTVELLGTKIEIMLKKGELCSWPRLDVLPPTQKNK
ncbi:unnamed protein product [Didymodactylos carnosus]|uniref:Cysteine and histidine-rich domain-containing protein 1 n=1 Tax=Didymodactylos carnosus TaxID=1234261 RepID=A0A815ACC0_9BILA|nr:unnamed protein product [Didymodactylos carnosus]CAF1254019.1 unnamed protein product [Didymodactylos carnosus]CAF3794442.1 unnamed protein product [Didymodactylos carnosus]CAF4025237.1 unnamed protein product [Didymodactylos carnosus]